ncbi:MAG: hypothetical protein WC876_09805 [Candidatus Thermoplasmatota archaeon]|jgi:hypothetical protein
MQRLLLAVFLLASLSGCLSDSTDDGGDGAVTPPAGYRQPDSTQGPDAITGMEWVSQPNSNSTTGIWVADGLAYLSGGDGLRIVDARDPEHPVLLAEQVPDTEGSRDVQTFLHPNGRHYAAMARGDVILVDVEDPTAPAFVSAAPVPGSHTVMVIPGTAVVYNSRSISAHVPGAGETGQIDIIDFTDPENPVVSLYVFPAVAMTVGGVPRPVLSTTCHEMTANADLQRAYCAGVTDTMIWDVADPLHPVILQVIDYPLVNIHHSVYDAHNGTMLIIGDEFVGVAAPTPVCSDTVPYPTSAVWFFDISDLALPTPLGYFQIDYDALGGSVENQFPQYCSTHLGDVLHGRDLLALGWYSAGTILIDFSDPTAPVAVDHYRADGPTSTWEARFMDGYVYTGDTVRGMDILKLV